MNKLQEDIKFELRDKALDNYADFHEYIKPVKTEFMNANEDGANIEANYFINKSYYYIKHYIWFNGNKSVIDEFELIK